MRYTAPRMAFAASLGALLLTEFAASLMGSAALQMAFASLSEPLLLF
jgi:hypothetical protein